jgi:hypothetical protein
VRPSVILVTAACVVLVGCSGSSKHQTAGERTDAREARAVYDVRERFNLSREAYDGLLRSCQSNGVKGPSFKSCARRKAEPFHRSAVRQAQRRLRPLVSKVGPGCRRAIRDAVARVGGPKPEPVLLNAQHACANESSGSPLGSRLLGESWTATVPEFPQ